MNGIIVKAISGFYYVYREGKVYECKARGNFRISGISPLVGDKVEFNVTENEKGIVESVINRKNSLKRPMIANLDKLFIVSAFKTPAPDFLMIDRLCAVSVYAGIEPCVVFNKSDLGDFSPFSSVYENAGFKTFTVSAKNKTGFENIYEELKNCTCAFAGNSGVGKSSILNSLFKDLDLKTGEVSQKLGRGKHTTRATELFFINGCFVADTPGFADIECENSFDFKEKLPFCFPDFKDYLSDCRFSGCTHTCEPGCSLLEALKQGKIEKTRFESYLTLFNELKNLKSWQK